ncbi:uncharacterized protein LOC123318000 isoform X2 [Coccinella septempunctata]|uniref:uncharacterized protein LOC123318000 isoform X2 n=1 Tax=Coccinella septempunctata TaxID=41139 RepID=UPI001D08AF7C|nr:uncharacterized protein LOC123318000 isoform X2 [Coccinella septempunctata]
MGFLGPIVWFQYMVFCYILQYILSMMSSHSPNSNREMFEFKETHSTPASTSKECDKSENILKGSALVDATDSVPVPMNNTFAALHNTNNFKYIDSTLPCIADKVPLAENEDIPNSLGTSDDQKNSSKLSDETNEPDDSWPQKDDKENENEEDLCLKCLYVSMKCCECTIM